MKIPADLYYTKDHEWVKIDGDKAIVGITDHAQDQLGDVVFVELPEVDTELSIQDSIGVVESTKAVSDIYSPVAGTVTEKNEEIIESPEKINEDPYGEAWLIKIKFTDKDSDLMDSAAYEEYLKEEIG